MYYTAFNIKHVSYFMNQNFANRHIMKNIAGGTLRILVQCTFFNKLNEFGRCRQLYRMSV